MSGEESKRKHEEEEEEEDDDDGWVGPRPEEAAAEPKVKKIKGRKEDRRSFKKSEMKCSVQLLSELLLVWKRNISKRG